jgi:succinate dehydrogenase / fumarate reductase, flavoprotein subunit
MGLYFRRDDQGSIVLSRSPVRWSIAPQQGQTSILLMEMRRKQLRKERVPFLDDAQVTCLVKSGDGRIAGAVALRYSTGEIIYLKAKAIVIATGHADRLTKRTTATREQSADGIALALRAGAELTNLEMQFWHASDFKNPKCWQRMHVYPNPLVGTDQSSRMYNSAGEIFFEQSRDAPAALAPYSLQIKRLIQQVKDGKASLEGGYYSSYSHIDPEVTRAYQYHAKAFDKLGYDIATDKIENCITMHYRQGGIESDPFTMETNVWSLRRWRGRKPCHRKLGGRDV